MLNDRPALTHAIVVAPAEPRLSRLLHARCLRDSKALPQVQEILAQLNLSAAHCGFDRACVSAGPPRYIKIIDVDSLAEDLTRVVTGGFDRLMTAASE